MTSRGGTLGTDGARRSRARSGSDEIWDATGRYLTITTLRLEVVDGADAGATRVFGRERVVIGSHESADFVVHDSTVSRMHCELIPASGRVVLRDLESKNGTAIHGVLVREATLTRSAVLELGHTKIRLSMGNDSAYLPLYDGDRFGGLVGQSSAMRRAFALAATAAGSDAPVLIEGEPGTGKHSFAAAIHERSARAGRPLIAVACGATPRELLDSELFGDDGDAAPRPGALVAAAGGSIILDQVGELPLELQARLLTALERRELRRATGAAVAIDARVIATTSRNLAAGINGHRFRSDLHARLAAIQIALPPLRARLADLPLLVAEAAIRLQLADDERAWLEAQPLIAELGVHHWPGNLRELHTYLEACVALRTPRVIDARGSEPGVPVGDASGVPIAVAVDTSRPFHAARSAWIDAFDRGYAIEALRRHAGDVTLAARDAGLDRLAFCQLLRRLGIRSGAR
jgi:DNA-binding NtrC family response regulator